MTTPQSARAVHLHDLPHDAVRQRSLATRIVRYGYLPMMLFGVNSAIVVLAHRGQPVLMLPLLLLAVALSFVAERIVPYSPDWNRPRQDRARDVAHAFVNEVVNLAAVASLPLLSPFITIADAWPRHWPFFLQVVSAIVVLDMGTTGAHVLSHKISGLWRFHAVHHSVKRFYGFNGLMKHPLHQLIELSVGVAPLVLIGLPLDVASAMAACVAVQLLLQHSNVDYATGPLGWLFALNRTHRFHHLKWPGIGDVNFGLFLSVWDRALGTHVGGSRNFTSDDLGIAAEPHYPVRYLDQLRRPFRRPRVTALAPLILCLLLLPATATAAPLPNVKDGPNAHEATAEIHVAASALQVYGALADVRHWNKLFSDIATISVRSQTAGAAVAYLESRLVGHAHLFSFVFRSPQVVRLEQSDKAHGSQLWIEFRLTPGANQQGTKVRATLHHEVTGFWGVLISDAKLRTKRREKLMRDLRDLELRFARVEDGTRL